MYVTIKIACKNKTFDKYPGEEVSRILRLLAGKVDRQPHFGAGYSQPLRDRNGTTVGYLDVWEREPTITEGK